ncbi:MAG: hypothetical protein AB1346_10080 [Thermodesulfobacteriota bacterium]
MEPSKIVVRYASGRVLKGHTQNFFPNRPSFHLLPLEGEPFKGPVEIPLDNLKAVFFVRDFTGNKDFQEKNRISEGEKPQGRVMEVTFRDNETILGTTQGYDPKRPGFFLFPVDKGSNNTRVFIVSAAVQKVRFL